MEFPIGAETNIRIFDDFSTLHWRIYHINPASSLETEEHQGPRILKKIELCTLALRNSGCLASPSSDGTCLWVFCSRPEFSRLKSYTSTQEGSGSDNITVDHISIQKIFEGTVSLAELCQSLLSEASGSILDPDQVEQRASNKPKFIRFSELTRSALYESFVNSIASSISRHLVKHHQAIPLGKRSFITVTDTEIPRGMNPPSSISTLHIGVSESGKLTVSLQSECQVGLRKLLVDPAKDIVEDLKLHDDIWLAPTGKIARYISTEGNEYIPGPGKLYRPEKASFGAKTERECQDRWKLAVRFWVENLGLPVRFDNNLKWIQVEITTSIRRIGSKKSAGIQRISWPAELCFKRSCLATNSAIQGAESLYRDTLGPLQYARKWLDDSATRNEILRLHNVPEENYSQQGTQASPDGIQTPTAIESMARTLTCPDFQPATVYPTPPGGALAFGQLSSDNITLSREYPLELSGVLRDGFDRDAPDNSNRNADMMWGGSSPAFAARAAIYDTAGDDGLFEEMEGNFDDKGITEADFNFFDEPGLSDSSLDMDTQNLNDDIVMEDYSEKEPKPDIEMSDQYNLIAPLEISQHQRIESPSLEVQLTEASNEMVPQIANDLFVEAKIDTKEPAERSMTPPLSPLEIQRILFPNRSEGQENRNTESPFTLKLSAEKHPLSTRHRNRYGPVPFQHRLDFSDEKYKVDGRFWFFPESKRIDEATDMHGPTIPVIGEHILPGNKPGVIAYTHDREGRKCGTDSEIDITSSYSSDSTSGDDRVRVSSKQNCNISSLDKLLRRADLDDVLSTNSSYCPGFRIKRAGKAYTTYDPEEVVLLSELVRPTVDWAFADYFNTLKPTISSALCGWDDIIDVAQLLVGQIALSSLDHKKEPVSAKNDALDVWNPFIDNVDALGHSRISGLKYYASVGESNSAKPKKDPYSSIMVSLRPPHVHIRRGSSSLEVLPTAIHFWETFSFEPLKGKKDLVPYCLHPISMQEEANAFLDRLGLTYTGANLGACSRPGSTKGLVPWSLGQDKLDYTLIMRRLLHICETLGSVLSNISMKNKNIVVFIINPFKIGAALVDICTAFLRLFHKYVEEVDKRTPRHVNELVLQIVPSDFIANSISLVIPTQTDYLRLALEVYSRCSSREPKSDMYGYPPAFILAAQVPRTIPFKLSTNEASPLDSRQPYHVAYSTSYDKRWVTAAWSDNLGQRQFTLAYSLGASNSGTHQRITEIRESIWQTTAQMAGRSLSDWRVVLAKDEPLDAEEVSGWTFLADHHNQNHKGKVELILLTVDISPCLRLKIPPPFPQLNTLYQPGNTATPASTPRPNMVASPDPSTNAPTPPHISPFTVHTPSSSSEANQGQYQAQFHLQQTSLPADPNAETILIDKSDEAWALVLSHRLNNSHSLTAYCPALASGYLIRRCGASDTNWLANLRVNLIYTQRRPPHNPLLKELLSIYRDLASLARARGIIHSRGNNSIPWHIAGAVIGQKFLSCTL